MTTLQNIAAYLFAPYCLEIESISDPLKMSQYWRYRFFSEDAAYTFVADWEGPPMMFRVRRRV